MTFGAVCPSLQTTWLIYELKIINRLLIMLPIINQRILNRLIIDISINWSQPYYLNPKTSPLLGDLTSVITAHAQYKVSDSHVYCVQQRSESPLRLASSKEPFNGTGVRKRD